MEVRARLSMSVSVWREAEESGGLRDGVEGDKRAGERIWAVGWGPMIGRIHVSSPARARTDCYSPGPGPGPGPGPLVFAPDWCVLVPLLVLGRGPVATSFARIYYDSQSLVGKLHWLVFATS
jgi:hypothetical protein